MNQSSLDDSVYNRGVVIIGATSSVAHAVARCFAAEGYSLLLAARNLVEAERNAKDLSVRYGISVKTIAFDAMDTHTHESFFNQCMEEMGQRIAGVVWAVGSMEPQEQAQRDAISAQRIFISNYTSAVTILERFSAHFEREERGFICALSSVAGDRGRMSNYIYGSAKAGLTTYLQGLRHRLYHKGVHVTTIKPGFMDTKMTYGMGLRGALSPEKAGRSIYNAVRRKRNVVYIPWPWRYIMLILIHIPEFVFKRMKAF